MVCMQKKNTGQTKQNTTKHNKTPGTLHKHTGNIKWSQRQSLKIN